MKILIDLGHPAHVHYFKYFIQIMKDRGHEFQITARDKEVSHKLLDFYGLQYVSRGRGRKNIFGKLEYLFQADFIILKVARKFRPDLFLSFGSPYAAQVSRLVNKPHIAFDDTQHASLEHLMYVPFTDVILTPASFKKNFGEKHIRFNSYMELCYLHPDYFKPDPAVLDILGVTQKEKYVILRFVSWEASHDIGHSGLSLETIWEAVRKLSKYAKIFISSERNMPGALGEYQINIPPEKMHDALAYATLLYGESATMASECACLGTPSIFHDDEGRCYTEEEENVYGLVYNYSESMEDQEKSLQKALEVVSKNNIKQEWEMRRQKMLSEKIDLTAFMVWFVENYPESHSVMRHNSDYQYNYR